MTGSARSPSPHVPPWARILLLADRVFSACGRLGGVLRDELLLAWLSGEQLETLTAEYYGRSLTFLPEGAVYKRGLFGWERSALTSSAFPRSGRILVGGIGGGREIVGLVELGYSVTGFEPSARLAAAASEVAASCGAAPVVQASYRDLVLAASGKPNRLSSILEGARFDGIIFGWGSISHLVLPWDRVELLRAARLIAPKASVLVSFLYADDPPSGESEIFRRWIRRVLRSGMRAVPADGRIRHLSGGAFQYYFGPGELETLAAQSGYDVALVETWRYSHAVLIPGDPY